ncbi:cytochrome c biogenesis protein CcdA [Pseudonocardiaceae bacterium YIM PH 21723]|nr:cytochrome c biogenesis protein CcdA [Pseudonocardiaceae bacterium YIM PH 21723]
MDIGYLAAFFGGVLALVSPCSALLLPSFFGYAFGTKTRLLLYTVIFYVGLALTMVPLGVAGSTFGYLIIGHRDLVTLIGGGVIIVLGIAQIFGMGFALRRAQEATARIRISSAGSVLALGAVYGLAGACAGPILGSVLTVAAISGNPLYGGSLLAVYALGMAVPLFVLALLWDRFDLGNRRWLRGRTFTVLGRELHSTALVSGLLFIALGVLFLATGGTTELPSLLDEDQSAALQEWLLRTVD